MRIVFLALVVKICLSQLSYVACRKSLFFHKQDLKVNNCFTMTTTNKHQSDHRIKEAPLAVQEDYIELTDLVYVARAEVSITKQKHDKTVLIDYQMSVNYWNESLRLPQNYLLETNLIEQSMLDIYKTFFNGPIKCTYHFTRTYSLLFKLLLFLIIRILLRGSSQNELQFLSFALINFDFTLASLISPSPSFSVTSSTISSHVGSHLNASQFGKLVTSSSVPLSASVKTDVLEKSEKSTNKLAYQRGECDMGWIQFESYCYLPFEKRMTFDHAQRACSYHAANLISITNKSENEFILNISRYYFEFPNNDFVWVGLESRISTSKLHWIDANDLIYQNWIVGEPDGNGACVQMIMKGFWEDCTCLEKNNFICKKRSSYPPPYSRTTELGILIGIPFTFALIVLSFVTLLLFRSIKDANDTFYGYGKNRNKEKMHGAIVNGSTAHVSAQATSSDLPHNETVSQPLSTSRVNPAVDDSDAESQFPVQLTAHHMVEISDVDVQSRDNLGIDVYDILHFPVQSRKNLSGNRVWAESADNREEIEMQACGSAASLDKEPPRFQSTTSLDHLVSKSYITPKSRKLRGLRQPEATLRPPGKEGIYRKKTAV